MDASQIERSWSIAYFTLLIISDNNSARYALKSLFSENHAIIFNMVSFDGLGTVSERISRSSICFFIREKSKLLLSSRSIYDFSSFLTLVEHSATNFRTFRARSVPVAVSNRFAYLKSSSQSCFSSY